MFLFYCLSFWPWPGKHIFSWLSMFYSVPEHCGPQGEVHWDFILNYNSCSFTTMDQEQLSCLLLCQDILIKILNVYCQIKYWSLQQWGLHASCKKNQQIQRHYGIDYRSLSSFWTSENVMYVISQDMIFLPEDLLNK